MAALTLAAIRLPADYNPDGIGPDAIVPVYLDPTLEMIIGVLGIMKAGAAYLPLMPGGPGERISLMVPEADASVVLTSSDVTQCQIELSPADDGKKKQIPCTGFRKTRFTCGVFSSTVRGSRVRTFNFGELMYNSGPYRDKQIHVFHICSAGKAV